MHNFSDFNPLWLFLKVRFLPTVLLIGVHGVSDLRVVAPAAPPPPKPEPDFESFPVSEPVRVDWIRIGGLLSTVRTVTFLGSSTGLLVGFTAGNPGDLPRLLFVVEREPNGIGGTVETNRITARLEPKGLVVIAVRWVVLEGLLKCFAPESLFNPLLLRWSTKN